MKTLHYFKLLVLITLFGVANLSLSQTTITLQPGDDSGKDANVWDLTPNSNRGSNEGLEIYSWTYSGTSTLLRGFIDFDFAVIPQGAIIDNAILTLYNNPTSTSTNGQHGQINGTNEMVISRVVQPWDEQVITWNNKPGVTALNEIVVPASTNPNQDYIINVTTLVQDITDDFANSYGFRLKIQVEENYRSVILASSNHTNPSLHPKIEITYSTIGIDESNNVNEICIYPNPFISHINIESESLVNKNTLVEVLDIFGKTIYSEMLNTSLSVDLSAYDKGIYIIKISSEDSIRYERILKL